MFICRPHKCPSPSPPGLTYAPRGSPPSIISRLVRRELGAHTTRRAHARLAHSHFAHVRTLRLQDDDAYFTHTVFHVSICFFYVNWYFLCVDVLLFVFYKVFCDVTTRYITRRIIYISVYNNNYVVTVCYVLCLYVHIVTSL